MATLDLMIKQQCYEVMVASVGAFGEKRDEFRLLKRQSSGKSWILARLRTVDGADKDIAAVRFRNARRPDSPYFVVEFQGYSVEEQGLSAPAVFSNGLTVNTTEPVAVLRLGKVLEVGGRAFIFQTKTKARATVMARSAMVQGAAGAVAAAPRRKGSGTGRRTGLRAKQPSLPAAAEGSELRPAKRRR